MSEESMKRLWKMACEDNGEEVNTNEQDNAALDKRTKERGV